MKMGGRGDGDSIDAAAYETVSIGKGSTAERTSDLIAPFTVRIGNPAQVHPGQCRQHAGMIAAHHPDADHADAQCAVADSLSFTHDPKSPPLPGPIPAFR